jgi:hypothetical protein
MESSLLDRVLGLASSRSRRKRDYEPLCWDREERGTPVSRFCASSPGPSRRLNRYEEDTTGLLSSGGSALRRAGGSPPSRPPGRKNPREYVRPSAEPVLKCTIPSAVDPTVAPPGRHLMSMFVQYAPYELRDGSRDDQREAFADRYFDLLNEYAPNFKGAVLDRQVLTLLDLERVFNLTGGNIFQGAMTPGQLFAFRSVPGYARYRTPVRGLYLCGAAAHPGGGVMGTPGLNAAREILGRRRLRARQSSRRAKTRRLLERS